MADIRVTIQLQDTVEDEIRSLRSSNAVNNVSIQKTGSQFNKLSTKSDGRNLKSWATGYLSLSDGYVGGVNTRLVEQYGYNGYVFGAVPENKKLTITLDIVGKYIDSIIIYGDKNANQFPTKAYRDGKEDDVIYSDDPIWAIKFNEQASSHSVTFLEWNRGNYNACITYVAELKNELNLDNAWLKSIESLSQSTGQSEDIYYGVVPNTGSLDIIDVDGEIKDYLQDGIMSNNNLPIVLKANGKNIQSHILDDGDYYISGNSKIFNGSLGNKLSLWNSIEFNGYDNRVQQTDAYSLLVWLIKTYYSNDDALLENMFTEKICTFGSEKVVGMKEYMQGIVIPSPYLEKSTLLEAINKVCEICQLWLYEDDNGNIKLQSARPKMFEQKDIIFIPKSKTYSSSSNIIVKNKYDGTKLFKNEFVRTKDKDTLFTLSGFYAYDKNKQLILDKSDKVYLDAGYSHYVAMNNNRMVKIDNYEITDLKFPNFANQISDLEFEVTKTFVDGSSYTYNLPRFGIDISMAIDHTDMVDVKFENNKLVIDFQITAHDPNESNLIINTQYMYSFSIRIVGYNKPNSYIEYVTGNKRFELSQNEILQTEEIINGINNNIVSDYSNGVRVADVMVGCLDYYDVDNKIIKNWASGEIISVGEFVQVETLKDKNGEMIVWKVVGRKFVYSGVPMVNLQLMEVIPTKYKVYFGSSVVVKKNGEKIASGSEVDAYDIVNVVGLTNDGKINYILANGENVELNQDISITSNTTISVSYTLVTDEAFDFKFDGSEPQTVIFNPSNKKIVNDEVSWFILGESQGLILDIPSNENYTFSNYSFTADLSNTSITFTNVSNGLIGLDSYIGYSTSETILE